MSDFLDRLVGGGSTIDTMLQPSIPSRFEPARSQSMNTTGWNEGINFSREESSVPQSSGIEKSVADGVSPNLAVRETPRFDSSVNAAQPQLPELMPRPPAENRHTSRPAIVSANESPGEILGGVLRTPNTPRRPQFEDSLNQSFEDITTRPSMSASRPRETSRLEIAAALNSDRDQVRSRSKDESEERQEHYRRLDDLATQLQQMQTNLAAPTPDRHPELVQLLTHRDTSSAPRLPTPSMIRPEQELRPSQPPRIIPEDLPSMGGRGTRSEPIINVTIGRVEVKAIRDQAQPVRPRPVAASPKVMTLDDYLKRRSAGGPG